MKEKLIASPFLVNHLSIRHIAGNLIFFIVNLARALPIARIMLYANPVKSKKILIIDDDDDIRTVINYILSEEGYEVTELNSGHSVLETVLKIKPDVILLDIMLGDMDGRDICKSLKANNLTRSIPIIMISASHGVHIVHQTCNANDYIAKPFNIEDLLSCVGTYAA